jgi:hypothetical protein
VILCTILWIIISLIAAPLYFAILFDIIPLMLLYVQLRLNRISMNGDYFTIENLFRKVRFKKDQCIGFSTISKNPFYTLNIQFKDNKSFRFNIGSYKTYWEIFPFKGRSQLMKFSIRSRHLLILNQNRTQLISSLSCFYINLSPPRPEPSSKDFWLLKISVPILFSLRPPIPVLQYRLPA